tara:strand:- start:124 stop:363 length:240 start_codon:yes stop_codon:yes gene_type:complete
MTEVLRFLSVRQSLLEQEKNDILRTHIGKVTHWVSTIVNALLWVHERSSTGTDWNSTKTRVKMVLGDFKENFLPVFVTH